MLRIGSSGFTVLPKAYRIYLDLCVHSGGIKTLDLSVDLSAHELCPHIPVSITNAYYMLSISSILLGIASALQA